MNGLLARVGIDSSDGDWSAPVARAHRHAQRNRRLSPIASNDLDT